VIVVHSLDGSHSSSPLPSKDNRNYPLSEKLHSIEVQRDLTNLKLSTHRYSVLVVERRTGALVDKRMEDTPTSIVSVQRLSMGIESVSLGVLIGQQPSFFVCPPRSISSDQSVKTY